jgi:hypothetical protein
MFMKLPKSNTDVHTMTESSKKCGMYWSEDDYQNGNRTGESTIEEIPFFPFQILSKDIKSEKPLTDKEVKELAIEGAIEWSKTKEYKDMVKKANQPYIKLKKAFLKLLEHYGDFGKYNCSREDLFRDWLFKAGLIKRKTADPNKFSSPRKKLQY